MKPAPFPRTCERHPALAGLHDPLLLRERGYIDGRWVGGDVALEIRDPATGTIVARVADFGEAEATLAVDAAPFGGIKPSGIGREGSRHGIEAFTELKYVCLDLA